MIALAFLIIAIIAPIVLVTAFFALEVFAGLRPLRPADLGDVRARTMIIIPAHDEQAVIGQTIERLSSAGREVLVIADNCGDETADVAKRAGAEVIVRNDPDRRGKGFALAAARDFLRSNPPEVVVIVDADCQLDAASQRALSSVAIGFRRACQATNLLSPDLHAPPMVQISNLAFMIKNLVRQRGLQRLADRAHLTGTGMALPWAIFESADLGAANIVEDLALGLDLANRARPPLFVEQATVWSPPASQSGTLVQRRRWEGGYLATSLKRAPAALLRSAARMDLRGIAAALDLSVPPLALLLMLNAVAFVLGAILAMANGMLWPLIVQVVVVALTVAALASAWLREGRRFASGATLLRLPLYVLWKLPIYLGLARRGAPKEWLRSGR